MKNTKNQRIINRIFGNRDSVGVMKSANDYAIDDVRLYNRFIIFTNLSRRRDILINRVPTVRLSVKNSGAQVEGHGELSRGL